MSARDQEVHDALVRTIACRLPACSEAELRAVDAALMIVERARAAFSAPRSTAQTLRTLTNALLVELRQGRHG